MWSLVSVELAGHMRRRALKVGFSHDDSGYAVVLTLVALPLIVGVAAFVIDASRVTNLHTDLQDASDAMALAGARELDGRDDAIPRAKAAIQAMVGNQAWFGNGGDGMSMGERISISYNAATGAGNVTVQFMEGIPAFDDQAVNGNCVDRRGRDVSCNVEADYGSVDEQSNHAKYVRVIANDFNVRTMFTLPGLGRDDVPVQAEAVATYRSSACDLTPIFICNPFEGSGNPDFHQNFKDGNLYARQITMTLRGSTTAGPGNFGYLAVGGTGGNVLRDALATNDPGVCYDPDEILTQPGGVIGPAEQGLGTRFGIYAGPMSSNASDPNFRPDRNVRMGQDYKANGTPQSCSSYQPESNPMDAMPLPQGTSTTNLSGGGNISNGTWDLNRYWQVSHGGLTSPPSAGTPAPAAPSAVIDYRPSLPSTATAAITHPSRYDVYQYELANNRVNDRAPGGERGTPSPQCYSGYNPTDYAGERRVIVAAIVDCIEHQDELNGRKNLEAEAYTRLFLTKPMVTVGSNKYISLEVIDVTGKGGMGTVEDYLREEAELVR